jgi:hypothetical protein
MKHYVYMVSENEETGERRLIKRCELAPVSFRRLLLGLIFHQREKELEEHGEEQRRQRERFRQEIKEGWYGSNEEP